MKKLAKNIGLFLCWVACMALPMKASNHIEVSLMTCAPGPEVYELYGHTALRYTNTTTGEDVVFNYGVFDFDTPNFMWKFAKGECDYEVMAIPYRYFEYEYFMRGSTVVQQVLNLTDEEEETLVQTLKWNCLPQNKNYRYNFLYNNCTTKIRDRIEEAVQGRILFPELHEPKTYRQIVRQYTEQHPWCEVGNDLCLGADADTLITARAAMFAPWYLSNFADSAVIVSKSGEIRPLVRAKKEAVVSSQHREHLEVTTPPCVWVCGVLVFLLICASVEYKKRKLFWGLDVALFCLQGLGGCVIAFLFFCSGHPTVDSNWQLWVLNPLPLLFMPCMVWQFVRRKVVTYHYINAVVITSFLLFFSWIPQEFSVIIVPLALTLLLISMRYIVLRKRVYNS